MASTDPFAQFFSGGLVAAKFPCEGFVVEGTVKAANIRQQTDYDTGEPKFWKDGSPANQMVIDLQCAPTGKTWETIRYIEKSLPQDDGMRALYVKGNLQKALTKALRDAEATFEIGGYIKVTRVKDGPRVDRTREPAHEFIAEWTPPSKNEAAVGDFLASGVSAPAPAPAAEANPFGATKEPPF